MITITEFRELNKLRKDGKSAKELGEIFHIDDSTASKYYRMSEEEFIRKKEKQKEALDERVEWKKNFTLQDFQKMQKLKAENWTVKEIAKELNVYTQTIYSHIHETEEEFIEKKNQAIRSRENAKNNVREDRIITLALYQEIQLLRAQGFSKTEVAKKLNKSYDAVHRVWNMTQDDFLNTGRNKWQRLQIIFEEEEEYLAAKINEDPGITNPQILALLKHKRPDAQILTSTSESTLRKKLSKFRREHPPKVDSTDKKTDTSPYRTNNAKSGISLITFRRIKELAEAGITADDIAKELGINPGTVTKYWNMPEDEYISKTNRDFEKIDKYRGFIIEKLKAAPEISYSAVRDRVREEYGDDVLDDVGVNTFNKYVKMVREDIGVHKKKDRQYHAVHDTLPGEFAQVDMGEEYLKDMYGQRVKVYFFSMILSYSHFKYVYFDSDPMTTHRFVYCHDKAFRFFGGMPKSIIYDQDKVLVVDENFGDPITTKEFKAFRDEAGFGVVLCHKHDPESKGLVEGTISYIKHNFLVGREYCGIVALNIDCFRWLNRTANNVIDNTLHKIPREIYMEEESSTMLPYKHKPIAFSKDRLCAVSIINTITFNKNKYAVPAGRFKRGDRVKVVVDEKKLLIFDPVTEDLVASYDYNEYEVGKLLREKEEDIKNSKTSLYKEIEEKYQKKKQGNYVLEFIEGIRLKNPRYINSHLRAFTKAVNTYGYEMVLPVIKECVIDEKFSMEEVMVRLISKYGIDKAKGIVKRRSEKYYSDRAADLSKYDEIMYNKKGDDDNGNTKQGNEEDENS